MTFIPLCQVMQHFRRFWGSGYGYLLLVMQPLFCKPCSRPGAYNLVRQVCEHIFGVSDRPQSASKIGGGNARVCNSLDIPSWEARCCPTRFSSPFQHRLSVLVLLASPLFHHYRMLLTSLTPLPMAVPHLVALVSSYSLPKPHSPTKT